MAESPSQEREPWPEPKTYYMFPCLHPEVSKAVSDHIHATWIEPEGNHQNTDNEYSTKVMGKFACSNDDCPTRRWSSKTVSVLIGGYPGNGYNAVIFNQRCKSCNELGDFILNENSYVERVAYRLKKWSGVQMERQHYVGKAGPPHKSELCEGCKRGYCQQNTCFRS